MILLPLRARPGAYNGGLALEVADEVGIKVHVERVGHAVGAGRQVDHGGIASGERGVAALGQRLVDGRRVVVRAVADGACVGG